MDSGVNLISSQMDTGNFLLNEWPNVVLCNSTSLYLVQVDGVVFRFSINLYYVKLTQILSFLYKAKLSPNVGGCLVCDPVAEPKPSQKFCPHSILHGFTIICLQITNFSLMDLS